MEVFFSKMGVKNLRFKPAYNPYTEPSLEIFSWHEGLGKWVEIGNSGMFRPEMLEPMGLPADVRVLGFGLSLERPTMIRSVAPFVALSSNSRLTRFRCTQLRHLQHPRPPRAQGTCAPCFADPARAPFVRSHSVCLALQVPLEMIEKSAAVRF